MLLTSITQTINKKHVIGHSPKWLSVITEYDRFSLLFTNKKLIAEFLPTKSQEYYYYLLFSIIVNRILQKKLFIVHIIKKCILVK